MTQLKPSEIERLARVAYEAITPESLDPVSSIGQPWEGLPELGKDRMRNGVRAVLEALREPTNEQLVAVMQRAGTSPGTAHIAIIAAIDAILSEPPYEPNQNK